MFLHCDDILMIIKQYLHYLQYLLYYLLFVSKKLCDYYFIITTIGYAIGIMK